MHNTFSLNKLVKKYIFNKKDVQMDAFFNDFLLFKVTLQ